MTPGGPKRVTPNDTRRRDSFWGFLDRRKPKFRWPVRENRIVIGLKPQQNLSGRITRKKKLICAHMSAHVRTCVNRITENMPAIFALKRLGNPSCRYRHHVDCMENITLPQVRAGG